MKRLPPTTHSKKAIRVVWLLIGSSVLTIASFVASIVVVEYRARGIEAAAESITTNALPSVACLSRTRTSLRQIEMALERLVRVEELGPPRIAQSDALLRQSRDALSRDWGSCVELPVYPGERALQEQVAMRLGEMNASISIVLSAVERNDRRSASTELSTRTEPALDRADEAMVEQSNLNAQESAALGSQIATLRTSTTHLETVLVALSALLATVSAFFMVGVFRRFTELMECRVSDMEHFAGRVAHDVRSPLASVALALELTKRNAERAIRTGMLDRATATLQRVGQLVDALLVFARSGRPPETASSTSVEETVRGVVEEMRPSVEASGITLDVKLPTAAVVACSAGVLISLVSNLLENAIKYMGDAPVKRVAVHVHEVDGRVRFEVRDTGPGVAPSLKDRIFDPYVRAGESGVPGLGLGLATVRRLVEAHGGSVGVRPNEGAGSIFWFELPKVRSTEAHRWLERSWNEATRT